jgi:molybdopterin molybdotransferase
VTSLAPPQALELVLARSSPLSAEHVPIAEALDRRLAEDVTSGEDVPGFDNSAMDGFAVRAADTRGAAEASPVELLSSGESRAGRPSPVALDEGRAIAISTGAMIPAGADAVVRKEDTRELADGVAVMTEVGAGENIRRAGEDVRAGETVLHAGTEIGPAEVGVLASLGHPDVACVRRPRVSVIATGDELVEPGQPLAPGQIRNSNAHAVPAQAARAGGVVQHVGMAPDDFEETVRALESGLEGDVLVICGGVSVGRHDHVKSALAQLGVEEVFWGLKLRPGHPTWFGVRDSCLVFGLPGNPVSAMVTFDLFVRPALAALQGARADRRRATAVMDADYRKRPGRAHVVRCRLEAGDDGWHVRPTKEQGSHVLSSLLDAEAYALLEVERGDVRAGERVEIEIL